jgi:hypothetical protein
MESQKKVIEDILNISMEIRDISPELSKFIEEMPVTIPNLSKPELNVKNLTEYCDSLELFLNKYAVSHDVPSK